MFMSESCCQRWTFIYVMNFLVCSQNSEKGLLASSYLSVCLSAWNNRIKGTLRNDLCTLVVISC